MFTIFSTTLINKLHENEINYKFLNEKGINDQQLKKKSKKLFSYLLIHLGFTILFILY